MTCPTSAFYTYGEATYNGITLYLIRTAASNIILPDVNNKNIGDTTYYGINGGFFDFSTRAILSVTVVNDVPSGSGVKLDKNYGTGWYNEKYARGTMVYDGARNTLSVRVVKSAGEISVTDRNNYWAQGGVSMSLNDDANWFSIATQQNLPAHSTTATSRRAALVYGDSNVWLVITPNEVTTTTFREAIKTKVATTASSRDAIFLDASGSAQMRSCERTYRGDNRPLEGIVALKAK